MAPPTGASDSILVLTRNGVSVEPHYGALAPQIKNYPMDANENKFKKTWGDKWHSNKTGKFPIEKQMIETSGFMVHPDYLNKYGTLSNGVLTKSIKYAETWLYGTVGVRGTPTQRPSLFLYPGVAPSPPRMINQNNYPTSSGAFLSMPILNYSSPSSERNGYPVQPPRKHTDQCFNSNQNELRIYQCNDNNKGIESELCLSDKRSREKKSATYRSTLSKNRSSLRDSISVREKRNNSTSLDPYSLMRKNRLGVDSHLESTQSKRRTASVPSMGSVRIRDVSSPCYDAFKPKTSGYEANLRISEDNWEEAEEETTRRKSILECDVNAYELNKSKTKDFDDFSDELSHSVSKADLAKLKIMRPKLNKTDLRVPSGRSLESEKAKVQNENSKKFEVRLSGQRLRICDSSASTSAAVGGCAIEEEDSQNILPRLPSPKRPPRRQKEKAIGETTFKYSKSRSKSSPNLSIKSILKKPMGAAEEAILPDVPFDSPSVSSPFPAEKILSNNPGSTVKSQSQCTLKKKKQVQFRVNNSYESLSKTSPFDSESQESGQKSATEKSISHESEKPEIIEKESFYRSKSCENLSSIGQNKNRPSEIDIENKNDEGECDNRKASDVNGKRDLHSEEDLLYQESGLKRSYSDRRLTSAKTLHKEDTLSPFNSPSSSHLFNDTMALRTRQNRMNSKEMFFRDPKTIQDDEKPNEKPKPKKSSQESSNVSSKSTQQLPGNLISFAEFSKLVDASSEKQSNCFSKTSGKKSNGSIKSHIPLKTKSPAPPPPVQRTSNEKVLKKGDAVSVKVPAKDYKKELTQPNLPASVDRKDSEGQVNKAKQLDAQESVPRSPTIHCETETADGKTVVRLNSSFEDKAESFTVDGKKASITIHTKNIVDESKPEAERKTSVIISKFHPQDTNKVRINVTNEPNDAESSSSTCTIIETGSNSTVIPVVSTDNKTTLIVGSNTPMTSPKTPNDTEPVQFAFSSAPNNGTSKFEQPSRYIFSTMQSEADKDITMMDPVEAIRRNLVPHICGKENGVSLMEKIKQLRETKEQINLKPISQVSAKSENAENTSVVGQPTESLISSLKSKKTKSKNFPAEEDSSTATSRSNSFCSTLNSSGKNSSTNTSRSNSFRSNYCKGADTDFCGNQNSSLMEPKGKFYILSDTEDATDQEKDKLECEYEIRNGFKENENIYEIIKEEPIYDRIESKTDNDESEDEVPPPLPLTAPPTFEEVERQRSTTKSIFEGASKYDILNYLVDAKERVQEESYFSGSSIGEEHEGKRLNSLEESEKEFINNVANSSTTRDFERKANESRSNPEINGSELDVKSKLNQLNYLSEDNLTSSSPEKETQKLIRKSSAEIERNDSGVGSETSHTSRSKWQVSSSIRENPQHLCEDCDQLVETQITDGGVMYVPLVCRKCGKKRSERKDIIHEIVETEEKYGRDLKIILEEFYRPMLVAGLLTPDQLSSIFLNTEELLENSEMLTERLRDTLEIALEQGDEDFLSVNVGKLFLEAEPMLHAFESYCTRQGAAALLLANLEKEKELLRIFLRVSQMENVVLRRMNLNSFLMVPVQRVTKYPLLLARLYKVTPAQQESRESLKEARRNIELHLEHMNSEAKDVSTTKVWRRFSTSTIGGRKSTAESEMINIKLRKMAIDILDWNHEEVRFVLEGKLLYTQPTDSNWKRGRTIKLSPIFVLLVTLGKPNAKYKVDPADDELTFPTKTGIREATLLLVKEKCGRYTLIREPLYLDKIIVCCETDADEYFEVQELSTKDSFIFKAEDGERTKEWYKQLQYHAQILGAWRKRRNALANIMINGMLTRAYTS